MDKMVWDSTLREKPSLRLGRYKQEKAKRSL